MRTLITIVAVPIMLLFTMSAAITAQTPQATNLASSGDQIFVAHGIDAPILARASVLDLAVSNPLLLLERIELPAGAQMAPHTTAAPELLYVESGTLAIEDNFGFATLFQSGSDLSLNPAVTYTVGNQGTQPASVLRFRLTADETDVTAATPVITHQGATPVVDASEPTVLIQIPLQELPTDASLMFLAQTTFSPSSDSGEQSHAGPIGIYVESGSLNVVSPSGLEGTIDTGQAVTLPAETPLRASTGDSEATAFIVGLVASDVATFVEVTPTPTPTPTPEPTTVPTSTPEPAPTPEPTSVPSPTPFPTTAAGTILQFGEGWVVDGASLTVSAEPKGCCWINLTLTYQNQGDSRVDFVIPSDVIRVYDDQRNTWKNSWKNFTDQRVILEPGDVVQYELTFDAPDAGYSANVFVVVEGLGQIAEAKWGFTWSEGRILTIPPDAVDPTASG